jgi:threonylcarbamoyladenosine tRNA methylthiotransferase MtaB
VIAGVRRLVQAGVRAGVLTGVDVTAYGGDLLGGPRLGDLVREVLAAVPELGRLRLTSLDLAEADDALWEVIGSEERLMPHLHLSLQSGDDLILKRMKRRHSRADAVAFAARARAVRPDVALGADLIAGFPTESDDAFAHTLALVDDCGLSYLHVFPYSPRAGTPAARMPAVPRTVVKERAARLRAKGNDALAAHLAARVGGTGRVLVEQARPDGALGKAEDYAPVRLEAKAAAAPGDVVAARFVTADSRRLVGRPNP